MYQELTNEQIHNAINMVASMTIFDLSKKLNKSTNNILYDFFSSKICKALYDVEAKIWILGPSFVEEEYLKEIKNKQN